VFLEPGVAAFISLRPIIHVVDYSVDLDAKICFGAIKIEYVWADRMLTAEDRLSWKSRP